MGSQTAAGSSLAISATGPATHDAAGFAALTFVDIGQVEKLGSFGASFAKVEFQPLKGAKQKYKGSADYGALQPSIAIDSVDAGQVLLQVAADDESQKLYSFCVTYQDGAKRYFRGRVFGSPETADGADSMVMTTPTVEISTRVVKVAAGAVIPTPALSLAGPLTFPTGAAAGTLVANVANVPAGVTPTITPNDGRLAVAGDATNGWKVVVGLTASSAGTITLSISAVGATSASADVTVSAAATVAPLFTAQPVINTPVQIGKPITVSGGTVNDTTATTLTYNVLRDGELMPNGYTPVPADFNRQFTGLARVSNSLGADAATSALSSSLNSAAVATVANGGPDPSFLRLPMSMTAQPLVGLPVLFRAPTYQGTGVNAAAVRYQFVENDVLIGAPTATLALYTPRAGVSFALETAIVGTNGTVRYRTPSQMAAAAEARTGILRAVSASNRAGYFAQTSPASRKIQCNDAHTIGSGCVDGFRLLFNNQISGGNAGPAGPGNANTVEACNAVCNGVVVPVTWGGATSKTYANGEYDTLSDLLTPAMFNLAYFPPGIKVLLKPRWDYPAGTVMPSCEQVSNYNSAECFVYTPGVSSIDYGIDGTGDGQVSGSGVSFGPTGPKFMLVGTFASGDPKTAVGFGNSMNAGFNVESIFGSTIDNQPNKTPIAGINFGRSGGDYRLYAGVSVSIVKYCNFVIDGIHINSIAGTAANSQFIIDASTAYWATMKANAATGAGLRPLKIIRLGFGCRLDTVAGTNNAISTGQVPASRMSITGDIRLSWTPAMLAFVANGTIAAYVDYRPRVALSDDPTSPLFYKAQSNAFTDGLHIGFMGRRAGLMVRNELEAQA